jgi:hypothetical protein
MRTAGGRVSYPGRRAATATLRRTSPSWAPLLRGTLEDRDYFPVRLDFGPSIGAGTRGEHKYKRERNIMAGTKRIFVGFAVEDKHYRDLLRGQSKLGESPIDYTDMSVKEPWAIIWKTRCRQRIKGCDGFIAPLSKNIRAADGACWEIKCAIEEKVPLLGVHIYRDDDYKPPEIQGTRVIRWTWDGISNWINRL